MARGNCWIKMGSLGCTWTKGWVSSIQNEMAHETHLKSCHIHKMSYNISCRINIVCVTVRIFWNWWFLDMFFNGSVDLKLDLLAMTPGKWFIEGNGRKEWKHGPDLRNDEARVASECKWQVTGGYRDMDGHGRSTASRCPRRRFVPLLAGTVRFTSLQWSVLQRGLRKTLFQVFHSNAVGLTRFVCFFQWRWTF